MCTHDWKKVNDVWVCVRCGITRIYDGTIIFDRPIANYKPKKRKVKRKDENT